MNDSAKELRTEFVNSHGIKEAMVPLFETDEQGCVATLKYGKDERLVLKRSAPMEKLMRSFGQTLTEEHRSGNVGHSGILYMMLRVEGGIPVPLYIGKAETLGRNGGNLSANIADLLGGHGKFGRWGYGYAYHLGDLSAVTLTGHSAEKANKKYEDWRTTLFEGEGIVQAPQFKADVQFWATLWGPEKASIWKDYGATRLAFEEYLLIGVASDAFRDDLLNREGRNR